MSTPFIPNPDKGDAVEHLKMGVSEFMYRNENLVREKNVIIDSLKQDAEAGWKTYIEDKMHSLLACHEIDKQEYFMKGVLTVRWFILIGFLLGGFVGYGVSYVIR